MENVKKSGIDQRGILKNMIKNAIKNYTYDKSST